jgi:hypothetical protein
MHDRIENEVAHHQPVGARQAVDDKIRLADDGEHEPPLAQLRTQSDQDLFAEFANVKASPLQTATIGGHLLERLHQLGRTNEVRDKLDRGIPHSAEKLVQDRSPDLASFNLAGKDLVPALQRGGDCQADPDGSIATFGQHLDRIPASHKRDILVG